MQLWHVGRVASRVPARRRPPGCPDRHAGPRQAFIPARRQGHLADIPEPQELTIAGIQMIVADYAQAARNAIAPGWMGGDPCRQWLSARPVPQQREQLAHRPLWRIGREPRAPAARSGRCSQRRRRGHRVGVRLSPMGKSFGMDDPIPKPCSPMSCRTDRRGLAYLHLVEPTVRAAKWCARPIPAREALMRAIRTAFSGPIILAGGYNAPEPTRLWPMGAAT
jgi:N-ethylmaleimide reductase